MKRPVFSGAYVGTYTQKTASEGIWYLQFSSQNGTGEVRPAAKLENPSYLLFSADRRSLYAVSETVEYQGSSGGSAASFAIDWSSGALSPTGQFPTFGTLPCHLCTDSEGKLLFVSNYLEGTCSVFPLLGDGRLLPMCQEIRHEARTDGKGDPKRQEKAHMHCAQFAPGEKTLLLCDLGIDKVMCYTLGEDRLEPKAKTFVEFPAGTGPRHCVFHPTLPMAYVACELSSQAAVIGWDEEKPELKQLASTLPGGYEGKSTCGAVRIAPDGRFLYVSNRGQDSIACFPIGEDGLLGQPEIVPSGGMIPRDIAIDPSGNWLLAANQNSDSIAIFARDPETGRLTDTEERIAVPAPVCICF